MTITCDNPHHDAGQGICVFCASERTLKATSDETHRWAAALREFGFTVHPGLTVKENLHAFGEWWAKRKADGN